MVKNKNKFNIMDSESKNCRTKSFYYRNTCVPPMLRVKGAIRVQTATCSLHMGGFYDNARAPIFFLILISIPSPSSPSSESVFFLALLLLVFFLFFNLFRLLTKRKTKQQQPYNIITFATMFVYTQRSTHHERVRVEKLTLLIY